MDRLSKERRSWNMSRIRAGDTKPEQFVRSLLHRSGFRFRKASGRRLPGRPDIVLPKHGAAIFVHGCFWHRHAGCHLATTPKTNAEFWDAKFKANVNRDEKVELLLRLSGWNVIVVWECELRDPHSLLATLERSILRPVQKPRGSKKKRTQTGEPR